MKGKLRKLVSMLLVAAMTMGMCVTAFAAEAVCSITIDNSINGKTYYVYKIFDATYQTTTNEDGDEVATGNVSYTIDTESPWLSLLQTEEGKEYFTLTPVYAAGYDANSDDADEHIAYYAVTRPVDEEGKLVKSDAELIDWLKNSIEVDEETGTATFKDSDVTIEYTAQGTGNGGKLTISGLEPGYYFVSTNNGSLISITTAAPDGEIVDKNQTPGDLHKYIVDDDGEMYDAVQDGMDEDVTFDITAHVPLYDGDKVVTEYVFTDTLSNGLLIELEDTYYSTSIDTDGTHYYLSEELVNQWVTLTNNDNSTEEKNFTDQVYSYTFELTGYDTYTDATTGETVHTFSGFILTFYTYDTETYDPDVEDSESTFDTSKYPVDADIEITYTAHVSSLEGYDNTNDIEMDWYVTSWDNPTPEEPEEGEGSGKKDHNDVYSWELELVKVDGETTVPLEGATFTLASDNMQSVVVGHSYAYVLVSTLNASTDGTVTVGEGEDEKTYDVVDFETTDYYLQDDGSYGLTVTSNGPYHRILTDKDTTITESTHFAQGTTDESGKLYFGGLGAGDYVLTEITAPDGYNILSDPIEFTINWTEAGGFTCTMTSTGVTNVMSDNYVLTLTIQNNAGALLPGTGGMGTTIFYVIGIVLVLGAAVLFVSKKRLDRE